MYYLWEEHLGKCLAGSDVCFLCGSNIYKMSDSHNINEKGKWDNQSPQDGLDPNDPKKNPPYEMGAKREN